MAGGRIFLASKAPTKKRSQRSRKSAFKRRVKAIVGQTLEKNHLDTFIDRWSASYVTWAGVISADLTAMATGDLETSRTGRDVTLKSIQFKSEFKSGGGNAYRIIVFQWKEDNNVSTPTVASILESARLGAVGAITSMYNFANARQYNILYDRIIGGFDTDDTDGTTQATIYKGFNKKISYTSATGANNNGSNHIYCLLLTNTVSSDQMAVNFRVNYHP